MSEAVRDAIENHIDNEPTPVSRSASQRRWNAIVEFSTGWPVKRELRQAASERSKSTASLNASTPNPG